MNDVLRRPSVVILCVVVALTAALLGVGGLIGDSGAIRKLVRVVGSAW